MTTTVEWIWGILRPNLTLVGLAIAYWITVGYRLHGTTAKLRHIPSVGYEHPLLYYIGVILFFLDVEEGFRKGAILAKAKRVGLFKYPGLFKWEVVITDPRLMSELFQAPSNALSMTLGLEETLQLQYSVGKNIAMNHYHADVLRNHLTRDLQRFIPRLHDEIAAAFADYIPLTEEWQAIPIMDTALKVVARASNRIFIGLPLCRDPEYIKANIRFTMDVTIVSNIFVLLPSFLKPIVAYFDNHVQRTIRATLGQMIPEIKARRQHLSERGGAKPEGDYDDLLTWFIQEAKGDEQTDRNLVSRMLTINFGAIHTSSGAFTQAMYYLASNQEWVEALRKEVDDVTHRLGWTKNALDEMHLVDSLVKESQRLRPIATALSQRVSVSEWRFSNGVTIPPGIRVAVSLVSGHNDPDVYKEPDVFDPFRFVKMRGEENTSLSRLQIVSTNMNSLNFGHGRTACPGRFFAAVEIKLMIAYLAAHYDFRLDGARPSDLWFGTLRTPNASAKISFRKRMH